MSDMPKPVEQAFAGFPSKDADLLREARAILFEAANVANVGPLTETLRWGEPAYLTEATKAGTTVRFGLDAGVPAVFFNCRTTLVPGFRADFPEAFSYGGNRALHLEEPFDRGALAICLSRALTYHRDKRKAG